MGTGTDRLAEAMAEVARAAERVALGIRGRLLPALEGVEREIRWLLLGPEFRRQRSRVESLDGLPAWRGLRLRWSLRGSRDWSSAFPAAADVQHVALRVAQHRPRASATVGGLLHNPTPDVARGSAAMPEGSDGGDVQQFPPGVGLAVTVVQPKARRPSAAAVRRPRAGGPR